jgi:predicted amidohydrolase
MPAMKIALIQPDIIWEDKKANLDKSAALIERAGGPDVAVLPEMFNTGFSMDAGKLAEREAGETDTFLSGLSKKHGINIIAGFQLRGSGEGKPQNIARVYDRQGCTVATYAKMHPFSFAGEDRHFGPGAGPVLFSLEGVPSSVFICYDLRFPEVFRAVAPMALVVYVLANWPSDRKDHWVSLLKARSIENQCFVVGVNRAGKDGNGIAYPGRSCVYGPSGSVVCSGGQGEEILLCELDPGEAGMHRARYPFLRDMLLLRPPTGPFTEQA